MKPARKGTQKSAGSTAIGKKAKGLTREEIAAMKETLKERNSNLDGESAVLAKIGAMPEPDRTMAKRIHQIVRTTAPELVPRTWYGMPAYSKGDKVVCFFQDAHKFKARYATLGFTGMARLDEGNMWPTSFALKELTAAEESRIAELVKQAVS
ncbi:MAG TPA: DUF1801 domain-containing protein [Nitrososphaerales archaeon]|nr:DUF1801 domain-containing protein [Nitrososphaerales archaeon]